MVCDVVVVGGGAGVVTGIVMVTSVVVSPSELSIRLVPSDISVDGIGTSVELATFSLLSFE